MDYVQKLVARMLRQSFIRPCPTTSTEKHQKRKCLYTPGIPACISLAAGFPLTIYLRFRERCGTSFSVILAAAFWAAAVFDAWIFQFGSFKATGGIERGRLCCLHYSSHAILREMCSAARSGRPAWDPVGGHGWVPSHTAET